MDIFQQPQLVFYISRGDFFFLSPMENWVLFHYADFFLGRNSIGRRSFGRRAFFLTLFIERCFTTFSKSEPHIKILHSLSNNLPK